MNLKEYIQEKYFVRHDGVYTTRTGRTTVEASAVRNKFETDHPLESEQYTVSSYRTNMDQLVQARAQREAEARNGLCEDEEAYIRGTLEDEGITPNHRWKKFTKILKSGKPKTLDAVKIETILKARIEEYNRGAEGTGMPMFKKESIIAQFEYMCDNMSDDALGDLQMDLKYDSDAAMTTDAWINELCDLMYVETERDVAVVVIKHMMWQIKRRLYGEGVKNDLWTAFRGAQGKGKSHVMRNVVFAFMDEFYIETQLSKIDDIDREIFKFTEAFVVNFEELALGSTMLDVGGSANKINKKTLNNLKSVLTAEEFYIRKMGGQKQLVLEKSFVPISTANEKLSDVIHDETGMRRFFELELNPPKELETFDQDKVLDLAERAKQAWKGIDEESAHPIWDWRTKVGKKIQAIQATYTPRTNINQWLEGEFYEASEDEIGLRSLYTDYKQYCTDYGYKAFGMEGFQQLMMKMFKYKKIAKRGTYFYVAKATASKIGLPPNAKKPAPRITTKAKKPGDVK